MQPGQPVGVAAGRGQGPDHHAVPDERAGLEASTPLGRHQGGVEQAVARERTAAAGLVGQQAEPAELGGGRGVAVERLLGAVGGGADDGEGDLGVHQADRGVDEHRPARRSARAEGQRSRVAPIIGVVVAVVGVDGVRVGVGPGGHGAPGLGEGGEVVGAADAVVGLGGERLAEGQLLAAAVEVEHLADGSGGRHPGGQAQGERQEVGMGHHVVHEAEPEGLVGGDEGGGGRHLPGLAHPDRPRQQGGEAPRGHHPEGGVGVGETGLVGGDHERGAEGDLQGARHAGAVHRADDGRAQRAHHRRRVVVGARRVVGAALDELEVDPGAEHRVGAGEHDDPHRGVGVGRPQRAAQVAAQRRVQGVLGLGPVDGEQPHAVVVGDTEVVAHRSPLSVGRLGPVRPRGRCRRGPPAPARPGGGGGPARATGAARCGCRGGR